MFMMYVGFGGLDKVRVEEEGEMKGNGNSRAFFSIKIAIEAMKRGGRRGEGEGEGRALQAFLGLLLRNEISRIENAVRTLVRCVPRERRWPCGIVEGGPERRQ
jgi:hypothetical protein